MMMDNIICEILLLVACRLLSNGVGILCFGSLKSRVDRALGSWTPIIIFLSH